MRRSVHAAVGIALALLLAGGAPAAAQIPLYQGDDLTFSLAGYVRSLTGLHDRGYEIPAFAGMQAPERQSGFHGALVRAKWLLEGQGWRIEAHDRVQLRIASERADGQVLGFGVGAQPERLVDLRTDLIDRDRVHAWHDIDRLSLTVHAPSADITLGRQAITWGTSTVFPVADLWAAFGPFEQDTDEKPGIDAVRALAYPARGLELDMVLAHRGGLHDLSGGVRATFSGQVSDRWVGAGKFWRQLMAMGGVTLLRDHSRWRAEAVLPWDMDTRAFQRPRITLGADWVGATRLLGIEYHHNGIGAAHPDDYTAVLADPRIRRGESYFLGRNYLGALGTWTPDADARLILALHALANLGDPSAAISPSATYDVGQAARLSIGALASIGQRPAVTSWPPAFETRSEFGLYGNAAFALISVYF